MVQESQSSDGGSGLVELRFHVPQDLVGLAIGREGVNVNAARRIPGIVTIEYDDYSSMFEIKGEVCCYLTVSVYYNTTPSLPLSVKRGYCESPGQVRIL